MNEEAKFLREHIKDICAYKGLQGELTYDVPLEILKRICVALDYLQQENEQLKEEIKRQDNLNKQLVEECQDFDKRIDKAIEYIEYIGMDETFDKVLIEILKGEDNNE